VPGGKGELVMQRRKPVSTEGHTSLCMLRNDADAGTLFPPLGLAGLMLAALCFSQLLRLGVLPALLLCLYLLARQ
jgi:hypothetical protein